MGSHCFSKLDSVVENNIVNSVGVNNNTIVNCANVPNFPPNQAKYKNPQN